MSGSVTNIALNESLEFLREEEEAEGTKSSLVIENTVNDEEPPPITYSNRLWIQATILNQFFNFSHQQVQFPDTPCGSYATLTIELQPYSQISKACACGYLQKYQEPKIRDFTARFQIFGRDPQFSIEPTCGVLNLDEVFHTFKTISPPKKKPIQNIFQTKKLTLVVRPEIPDQLIEDQAKALKIEELIEVKRKQLEMKRQKELAAKEAKAAKKGKKKSKKGDPKSKSSKSSKSDKSSKKKGMSFIFFL